MPRLIPQSEVLRKTAALRFSDWMGREQAHLDLNTALASEIGHLLAKEAGIFSTLGGKAQQAAQAVSSGAKNLVGKLRSPAPFHPTPGAGGVHPYRSPAVAPTAKPDLSKGWGNITQQKPAMVGGQQVGTQAVTPPAAHLRSEGKVVPREAMGGWHSKNAPDVRPSTAPQTAPQTSTPSKGVGWGKALALGGLGLGVYGAFKAVPWAARQLEQSSGQSMAPSLGWSPVPYGYGYNPYGQGMQTMGQGA